MRNELQILKVRGSKQRANIVSILTDYLSLGLFLSKEKESF